MIFKRLLTRFFSTQYMVKAHLRLGEPTPTREAYQQSARIALPAVAEMVTIALIGMVDMAMVGRLGAYAVTAIGLTMQPRMIFLAVFFAFNVAVTAIVSRMKGNGNREAACCCVRQALLVEMLLVVAMTALSIVFAWQMMWLAGAQANTLEYAVDYFRIMSYSIVFQAISMTLCAAQRGVGNTKITMKVNIAANVIKIIFNFLLIEGIWIFPRLEVRGAAIATFISAVVGCAFAIQSVLGNDGFLRLSLKDNWRPNPPMLKSLCKLASGAMLEQVAFRVGFFAYARVVAGLGTNAFAAHQVAMQLMGLSWTFAEGIGAAATSLVGQNLGKKRPDLSIMYGKIGQRQAFVVSIILGSLCILGRTVFPSWFLHDPEIIQMTSTLIVILAFMLPIQTSHLVMSGSLRGAGDTKYVAVTMLVTVAFLRPLASLGFIYGLNMGLIGAWVAIIFDQIIRLVMIFTRFSRGKWIEKKI
jgi:putative MATE family efflux protein